MCKAVRKHCPDRKGGTIKVVEVTDKTKFFELVKFQSSRISYLCYFILVDSKGLYFENRTVPSKG